jgi:hypothetical protein
VLIVPAAFLTLGSLLFDSSVTNSGTHVRAGGPPGVADYLLGALLLMAFTSPFAMVAAWRTWVHAKRRTEGGALGWQGVAEAGALGIAIALVTLLPGILTRPFEAPPYVVFYGGAAFIFGVGVGFVLYMTGSLALRLHRPATR